MMYSKDYNGNRNGGPRRTINYDELGGGISSSKSKQDVRDRVIGVLRMDSFETQVYLHKKYGHVSARQLYSEAPIILSDAAGRIVSTNYEAERLGIVPKSHTNTGIEMAGKAGRMDLVLMRKPDVYDKPESKSLRHASWNVLDAIIQFRQKYDYCFQLECPSSDEFYVDLTADILQSRHGLGHPFVELSSIGAVTRITLEGGDKSYSGPTALSSRAMQIYPSDRPSHSEETRLLQGAIILERIRTFVLVETKYQASVGVGTNKMLAKMASTLHKPGGIVILPPAGLSRLSRQIWVEELPTLGPKIADILQGEFNEGRKMTLSRLADIPLEKLILRLNWTLRKAQGAKNSAVGLCFDPVLEKLKEETLRVGKSDFVEQQPLFIANHMDVRYVFYNLVEELLERLHEERQRHRRIATEVWVKVTCKPPRFHRRECFTRCFTVALPPDPVGLRDCKGIVELAMTEFHLIFGYIMGEIVKVELEVTKFKSL